MRASHPIRTLCATAWLARSGISDPIELKTLALRNVNLSASLN
jgi:hypothetical protein